MNCDIWFVRLESSALNPDPSSTTPPPVYVRLESSALNPDPSSTTPPPVYVNMLLKKMSYYSTF